MKPNTQLITEWWEGMSFEKQFFKTIEWLLSQGKGAASKHPHQLTTEEIKSIYEHNSKN